jgi:hypothetical protein
LVNVSFAVDLPLVSVALSLAIRLRQVSAKEEMTMSITMSINAILFDLFSTTTFPISVPAALTVAGQPLAMAAAPLVIGLGAWAATVMGIAMVFQDGRLKQKHSRFSISSNPSEASEASAIEQAVDLTAQSTCDAIHESVVAQNNRRAFKSSISC